MLKKLIRALVSFVSPAVDALFAPVTFLGAVYFAALKRVGLKHLKVSRAIFHSVGMFPLRDHYYEPLFNPRHLKYPLDQDRVLPGIDLASEHQLSVMARFVYSEELRQIPVDTTGELSYYYHNGSYESGDAEFLYQIIRLYKPRKIIEIGCGLSTLLIQRALTANLKEDAERICAHICVEPYENPWLEKLPVTVQRSKVEDLPLSFFSVLGPGDILFIDSSHVVRPQGDCEFEYLRLLPSLAKGVLIHVHDIFTPKDYPREWIAEEGRIWTEQYLLEAFLTNNPKFRVIGAVNYLHHHHREALARIAPMLATEPDREPGAFWIEKIQ